MISFSTELLLLINALMSFIIGTVAFIGLFKMVQIHKQTNSMKDELVSEVRSAATAVGVKQGRAEKAEEILAATGTLPITEALPGGR